MANKQLQTEQRPAVVKSSHSECCGALLLYADCPRSGHGGALDLNGSEPRCGVCGRFTAIVCSECGQPV
jgi:hypothetical protein